VAKDNSASTEKDYLKKHRLVPVWWISSIA